MSAKENKGLMRRLFEEYNKGKAAAMAAIDRSIDRYARRPQGLQTKGERGVRRVSRHACNH